MALSLLRLRGGRPTTAVVAATLVLVSLALPSSSAAAPVSSCKGKYIRATGDLDIHVRFRCNGEFNQFSVRTNRTLDLFEGTGLVFPAGGGEQVASFECAGDIPGRRVVCAGEDEDKAEGRQLVTTDLGLARRSCRGLKVIVRVTNDAGETSKRFRMRGPRSCRPRRR